MDDALRRFIQREVQEETDARGMALMGISKRITDVERRVEELEKRLAEVEKKLH